MIKTPLTDAEELSLWYEVKAHLKFFHPPASKEEANNLLAILPPRRFGESFRQWLERSQEPVLKPITEERIHLVANPRDSEWALEQFPIFKPITEIIRLAADTSDSEFPLPDPGRALESVDGQFRLHVLVRTEGKITLRIEALGTATDKFAQQWIGIARGPSKETVIAQMVLNEDGDGECTVEDQVEVRKTLLRPTIGIFKVKKDA